MPIYDNDIKQQPDMLDKQVNTPYQFSDGGFYPFLKYLLQKATNYKASQIYVKDYGENNPFLEQSGIPKIYCDLIDFNSQSMTSILYANGNTSIIIDCKYRIYFANDNVRGPLLLESALKGSGEELHYIIKEYKEMFEKNKQISLPDNITMASKKVLVKDGNVFPIIAIDIVMRGKLYYNIEELRSAEYDSVETNAIVYTK